MSALKLYALYLRAFGYYYRLWEEKYGDQAMHIKNAKGILSAKFIWFSRCYFEGTRKSSLMKSEKKLAKTFEQNSVEKRESLHPSWEASRRRKAQSSIQTPFQGQRIVFGDSD